MGLKLGAINVADDCKYHREIYVHHVYQLTDSLKLNASNDIFYMLLLSTMCLLTVSPLSILGHYFDVVFLGKTLYPHMLHLTQV